MSRLSKKNYDVTNTIETYFDLMASGCICICDCFCGCSKSYPKASTNSKLSSSISSVPHSSSRSRN
ncbi:hypothetical protein J2Z32_000627 [Paenibacillus turicensis]|uniref:Bacteriocin n=1 Tax=Paenibacillus turicensis TaxID=160487 RepID=A0ABS4FN46_9BACL|nr:hypothetical protein [Paenibacillus turicensis]